MAIQIEINDAHIDALIDFYIQRLRVLRDEISDREKESKEVNSQILRLKKGKGLPSSNDTNTPLLTQTFHNQYKDHTSSIRF